MTETLQLGGLGFEVRRSDRRKTLGITVDRGGELVAHVPAETAPDELSRWISKKLLWVRRKLALKEEASPKVRSPEFVSGESFCYLGRRYRLKLGMILNAFSHSIARTSAALNPNSARPDTVFSARI